MSGSGLEIVQIPAGPIETNAFLVIDRATRDAFVIDAPPDLLDLLTKEVEERAAKPVALIITHTHWDHIGDTAAVARQYGIPIYVHDLDRGRLEQPESPVPVEPAQADRKLAEGDTLMLGEIRFDVLHTPGHSPGEVTVFSAANAAMFGGDTLFPNGYGRVDIPGASETETVSTIRRLLEMPDEVVVYPGHGAATTIGRERPWMEQVARTGRLLE